MAVALIIGMLIVYLSQLTESTSVEVRLANSTVQFEGRLEVYHNGVWGTVCDDLFDDIDATVACKSIGSGLIGQTLGNKYGGGTAPIWLDNLRCRGSETYIGNCRHRGWGVHDCEHNEDISIACYRIDDLCPHYYNGNCFYASNYAADQLTARSHCQAVGADLASISNQAEMDFVANISPAYNWNGFRYTSTDYWFGLYKVSAWPNATTKWYDDNLSTYRNWAAGEPNGYTKCVSFTEDGFKDRWCNRKFYYTCKKRAVATAPTTPLPSKGTLPPATTSTTTKVDINRPVSFVTSAKKEPMISTTRPTTINCTTCLSSSVAQETSQSSAFEDSSNGSTGLIIGVAVGVVVLLLLLIVVLVVVIVVIRRNRRKSSGRVNNAGNLSIVSTPNIYGTDHAGNSFPLGERPNNQADMGYEDPPPIYSATQVYADVRGEPTATNAANKDDRAQPSAPSTRSSLDKDITLIDNDLYG